MDEYIFSDNNNNLMPNLLFAITATEIKLQDLAARKIKNLEIKIWSDLCSHKTHGFYRGKYLAQISFAFFY